MRGLLRNERMPIDTVSLNKQSSMDAAIKWIAAYLSPGTASINDVRIPTGLTVHTAAMAKNSSYDITPDGNGNVLLFMLPFLEAPFAQYDTQTNNLRVYQDLTLGKVGTNGYDFMRNERIYGFRACFQSLTIENNSNEFKKQGTCIASLMPAQIDNHEVLDTDGRRYLRVVDNLPITAEQISASVKTPYTGLARDGCYIVNRNYTNDWNVINRDSDWNKATTTVYALNTGKNGVAATGVVRRNPLAYRSTDGGAVQLAALTNAQGVIADTLSADTTVAVSGLCGTQFGIGVALFTNQDTDSTYRVKLIHGYEFLLKPESTWNMITAPPPFEETWAFKAVCLQLATKLTVYPADANFWGAILKGLATVIPAVLPVVQTLLPSVGKWLSGKTDNVVKKEQVVDIGTAGLNKIAALVTKAASKK